MGGIAGAMARVTASMGRISRHVSVIDGIAFQTNILALRTRWKRPSAARARFSRWSPPKSARWRCAAPKRRAKSRNLMQLRSVR
jgi:hypothetical protein